MTSANKDVRLNNSKNAAHYTPPGAVASECAPEQSMPDNMFSAEEAPPPSLDRVGQQQTYEQEWVALCCRVEQSAGPNIGNLPLGTQMEREEVSPDGQKNQQASQAKLGEQGGDRPQRVAENLGQVGNY
ncbi:hypothetical protein PENARI_c033G06830 [Penicillium arizonense]|uniref:Uncharacterized protein n=1 Tax=Penicillium arizonense TaxID=1835702 RepID=A0A1F5L529_PENAI|nr:hypothetical protein PENARI_c033G06830 [Penicillium arizonense]OGE48029.1 hypothetical protein PENARI_c033G06830 [Penicillium arizonense]